MGINRVLIALVLISPDLLQQRQPRKHLTGMAGEVIEQIEFARRQVHHLAAQLHFARQRIDAQAMAGQAPGVHQQVLPHRLLATKQRFDAGDKLQQ
ncbi:unknown [Klebsiella variicola CAG:634]|nr:unknown [Klebsiella variicola CAG:634]